MGADIHMILELKVDDKWVGLHNYPHINTEAVQCENGENKPRYVFWKATNRNYELFSEIAGVRGEGPPPRGMPLDMSDLARMYIKSWDGDGHSHTWLSEEEAIRIWAPYVLKDGNWVAPDRRQKVGNFLGMNEVGENKHRLVIFFDN